MSYWNDDKDGLDTDRSADGDECVKATDAEAVSNGLAASSSNLTLLGIGNTMATSLGGRVGSGPCSKMGSAAFIGNKVSSRLVGDYTLTVTRTTAKLSDAGGKVVYKGVGLDKGLTGTWLVKF